MRIFAKQWVSTFLGKLGMQEGEEIQSGMVSRMIERVQRKMEAHNFDIRKNLLEYDAVNNDQRKVVYGWRQAILEGADQTERAVWAIEGAAEALANHFMETEDRDQKPDLAALRHAFQQRFVEEGPAEAELEGKDAGQVAKILAARALEIYARRKEAVGAERMRELERYVLLQTIDDKWKDHLHALDYLRTGIGMRGYGQEDPKVVYRREAANYFGQMISSIRDQVVDLLYRIRPAEDEGGGEDEEAERPGDEPAPAKPADGFDEDEWGADDDGVEWDKVVAAESLREIARAVASERPAAATAAAATARAPSAALTGLDDEDASLLPPGSSTSAGGTAPRAVPVGAATPAPATEGETADWRERQRTAARAATAAGTPAADPMFRGKTPSPNEPCPCGSGRKFKKCHGS